MKKIRWLHVSDIHLNRRGVDTRRMRNHLPEYLKEKNMICDYVFFTGDLRYAPEGDFAEDTIDFLENLCHAVKADKKHLFLVPGNHDIDRNCTERQKAIERIIAGKGYYHPSVGKIRAGDLAAVSEGKKQYIKLMERLFSGDQQRIDYYRDMENPHFCVETEDFNILHMDSTLVYSQNRERDLIFGTELLMDLLETINPKKPTILLTHYSFDFLARNEQKQVLKLLEDFNVQLWFAGHEHTDLLRRQRDYFFEFQCGNLLHEDEDTRSEVITGEYDRETRSGKIQVHVWNAPDGWELKPYISRNELDRSTYLFTLQDSRSRIRQITDMARNTQDAEGKEGKQARYMEMADTAITQNDQMAVGNSKEVSEGISVSRKGFLYLDGSLLPFAQVNVNSFSKEGLWWYGVEGDGWRVWLLRCGEKYLSLEFSYNLSGYTDVADRLYRFQEIRKYIRARQGMIKISGDEKEEFVYDIVASKPKWETLVEETDFWYECMLRIARIEEVYGIKFTLPPKTSGFIYRVIEILSDSIEKKSSRLLPGIPMKHPGFSRKFCLEQEVFLSDGSNLPALDLFGFSFYPVAQFILPGEFSWNRKKHVWESKREDGGIPVRVEFVLKENAEKRDDAVFAVPCEASINESGKFPGRRLNRAETKDMQKYLASCRAIRDIHGLFLNYEKQIANFIRYDQEGKGTEKFDRLRVNELTDAIISAGILLIDYLYKFVQDNGGEYSGDCPGALKQIRDYGGDLFFLFVKAVALKGHLSVGKDGKGNYYYDLKSLGSWIRQENDEQLNEVYGFLKGELEESGKILDHISHYEMLRNFLFAVAEIYLDYYLKWIPYIDALAGRVENFPEKENMAAERKEWKGYAIFTDADGKMIYGRKRDFHLLTEFSLYQLEARQSLEEKGTGLLKG